MSRGSENMLYDVFFVVLQLKGAVEDAAGSKYEEFEPVAYTSQVVRSISHKLNTIPADRAAPILRLARWPASTTK